MDAFLSKGNVSVGFEELDDLCDRFDHTLQEIPEMRQKYHAEIGEKLKALVDSEIAGSKMNDSNDKIKNWQETHVGSGGGYAAVRPRKGTTGDNSPGAITNYLDSGHRIRPPGKRNEKGKLTLTNYKYKSRAKVLYVDGYHFYGGAYAKAENVAIALAEELVNDIADKLEGEL